MNNRGEFRGAPQQPVPAPDPLGPPAPLPGRFTTRVRPQFDPRFAPRFEVATVPRRIGQPGNPADQRPPQWAGAPAPTAPGIRVRSREPVRPEANPGWARDLDVPGSTSAGRFDWRGLLHRLSRIARSAGKNETYLRWLAERAGRPLGSAFPIAVLNLKGGVGKTTVVEALGSTFAGVRQDGVIAVDLDSGDLGERHGHLHRVDMVDVLADGSFTRYLDERALAYKNGAGLDVLGLPDYAPSEWQRECDDFVKVSARLRKHYSILLVDCVKSLKSSGMRAVLLESQGLVIVSGASVDALRKTRATLNWLRDNGYQRLLDSTVLAVNHTDRTRPSASANMEIANLSGRVAAVVMLPYDRHVREGVAITLQRLSRKSRLRYLELAAVLSDLAARGPMPRNRPAEVGADRGSAEWAS